MNGSPPEFDGGPAKPTAEGDPGNAPLTCDTPAVRSPRPLCVIGLAGGVGSGKSTVGAMFRELGACVVESDEIGRHVLCTDEVRRTLREWWGDSVFGPDGLPDRARIAGRVFDDPDQRRRLEQLLHPLIGRERRRRMDEALRRPGVTAIVIDAPLLFEAGLDRECDAIVFVDAPESARRRRVATQRGWSEDDWSRREAAQLPVEQKRRRADYVCVNDADLETLRRKVQDIFSQIVSRYRGSESGACPTPAAERETPGDISL